MDTDVHQIPDMGSLFTCPSAGSARTSSASGDVSKRCGPLPTLVSCPIYLSPATTRTKSIRLHQVWQATRSDEADEMQDQVREQDVPKSAARFALDDADDEADQVR